MAVYDKLPERNLKAEDIRDTLLANGADWSNTPTPNANYLPNYFRKESNINMWSYNKPTRHESILPQDDTNQAFDGSYDILTPIRQHNPDDYYRELPTILNWRWLGYEIFGKYPLRLSDYAGYNSKALTPIEISREELDMNLHGNNKVVNVRLKGGDIDVNKIMSGLSWNDIHNIPISKWKIHLVFHSAYSLQNALYVSSTIETLNFENPVTFRRRLGALENKTYYVRPFLVYEVNNTPIHVIDFFNDSYYNKIDDITARISGVIYNPIEDSPYALHFTASNVLLEDNSIGNLGLYPIYQGNNIADTITVDNQWYPDGTHWAIKCSSKKEVMVNDFYVNENGQIDITIKIRKYQLNDETTITLPNLVGTLYRTYNNGELSNKITKTTINKIEGDYYISFDIGRNEIIKKFKDDSRFFSEVTINHKGHFVTYFTLSIINKLP